MRLACSVVGSEVTYGMRTSRVTSRPIVVMIAMAGISTVPCQAVVSQESAGASAAFARDGHVNRGDFELFYRVVGDSGPRVVVLAGGPGGEPSYMQPVLERLRGTYQCLLLEQRGTGRSKLTAYNSQTITFQHYLDDLEALRQHLRVPKLLLIGHSWGGMLALSYAGTFPNRARAVVSIDAGPIAEEHAIAEEANAMRRLEHNGQILLESEKRRASDATVAFGVIQRASLPAYFFDPQKAVSAATWLTGDPNLEVMRLGYEPAFGSLHGFIRSRLRAITAPVLLVHGRQDAVAEGGVVEAHQLIKRSKLALIDKCGHLPWIEEPGQMWLAVESFLSGVR